jgi:hypothetical protein
MRPVSSRVEAGSNTSTVTLRVVGGDAKGSLKSGTVKYCHVFGIQKGYFHGNDRTDRCIGSNNRGIVILTGVSTITKEGSMRSNGRRYKKVMHSKRQSWDSHHWRQLGSSLGNGQLSYRVLNYCARSQVILQAIIIVRCKSERPIKIR